AMFRDRFWLSLLLTIPVILLSHDPPEVVRVRGPRLPGIRFHPGAPRDRRLPVRRPRLPSRGGGRARRPSARDDDADLARARRRVRYQLGGHTWPVRGRDLVGALDTSHHHAPGSLARDALDRPGSGCA